MATMTADNLMTSKQVAERLGVTEGTLRVWRTTRRYPLPWVKVGKAVRYTPEHVDRFIAERTENAGD